MAARKSGHPDASLSLALAVVASATVPLVLLDGDLRVIAASAFFCRTFELQDSDVTGEVIYALGGR